MININESKKTIKIANVVASTTIGTIDLDKVIDILEDANYNKKKFPGIVYKTTSPKIMLLIFRSGKIVCTGTKNFEDAKIGLFKIFEKLKTIGVDIPKNPDIKIHNIVATANLGRMLNLNATAIGLGFENVEFEPEQFPCIVYRILNPRLVVMLFSSGKLVITGGKKLEDIEMAMGKIMTELDGLGLL